MMNLSENARLRAERRRQQTYSPGTTALLAAENAKLGLSNHASARRNSGTKLTRKEKRKRERKRRQLMEEKQREAEAEAEAEADAEAEAAGHGSDSELDEEKGEEAVSEADSTEQPLHDDGKTDNKAGSGSDEGSPQVSVERPAYQVPTLSTQGQHSEPETFSNSVEATHRRVPSGSVLAILQELRHEKKINPRFFAPEDEFNAFQQWDTEMSDLKAWSEALQKAISQITARAHKGFNIATSKFGNILHSFTHCQQLLKRVDDNVAEAHAIMRPNPAGLQALYLEDCKARATASIFNKVRFVMTVPSLLNTYLSRHQFVHAVRLLKGAKALIVGPQLCAINGLFEIRDDIFNKKNAIQKRLFQELNDQIYMRSEQYQQQQLKRTQSFELDGFPKSLLEASAHTTAPHELAMAEPHEDGLDLVYSLHQTADNDKPHPLLETILYTEDGAPISHDLREALLLEDKDSYRKDPRSSSEQYMHVVLDALFQLDHLASAPSALQNQIKAELHSIIRTELEQSRSVELSDTALYSTGSTAEDHRRQGTDRVLLLLHRIFRVFLQVLLNHKQCYESILKRKASNGAEQEPSSSGMDGYTVAGVWEAIMHECQKFLKDTCLAISHKSSFSSSLSSSHINILGHTRRDSKDFELEFSFDAGTDEHDGVESGLDDMPVELSESTGLSQPWIQPSLYHVSAIYKPVMSFIEQALHTLDDDTQCLTDQSLSRFLDMFVQRSFLAKIQTDSQVRVREIISGAQAFRVVAAPEPLERSPTVSHIVSSAVDIADQCQDLVTHMRQLDSVQDRFLRIVEESVIDRVLEAYQDRYIEVSKKAYAFSRIADPQVIETMARDPAHLHLMKGSPIKHDSLVEFFRPTSYVYQQLFSDIFRLNASQLILEPSGWLALASLSSSMEWLSWQLAGQLCVNEGQTASDASPTTHHRHHSSFSSSVLFSPHISATVYATPSLHAREHKDNSGVMSTEEARLQLKRSELVAKCQSLALRCLFTLKLELQCQCFYFLKSTIWSSYWYLEEPREPESFILELNKALALAEESLQHVLPPRKMKYLFQGLGRLECAIVMHSLSQLQDQRVNRLGAMQLHRNFNALQQNLTNLVSDSSLDKEFERARQYVDLLGCSDEEFKQFLIDSPEMFTENEMNVVIDLRHTSAQHR